MHIYIVIFIFGLQMLQNIWVPGLIKMNNTYFNSCSFHQKSLVLKSNTHHTNTQVLLTNEVFKARTCPFGYGDLIFFMRILRLSPFSLYLANSFFKNTP